MPPSRQRQKFATGPYLVENHAYNDGYSDNFVNKRDDGNSDAPARAVCELRAMKNPATLGQRIKALRLRRRPKVSVEEAADAIGIARSTLSSIENDHDVPGRQTLIAIADYYDVSVDWLSTGVGMMVRGPVSAEEALLLWLFRSANENDRCALLTLAAKIAGDAAPPDWISEPWTILEDAKPSSEDGMVMKGIHKKRKSVEH